MLPFERVSLDLTTLCGAIPLDNFLANDYDDSGEIDYREFENGHIRYQECAGSDSSDSEGPERTDGEGDVVIQMLMDVDGSDLDGEGINEEDGLPRRVSRLRGSTEKDARTLNEASPLAPKAAVDSEAGSDPLEATRETALEKLHNACTRLSGTVEALHFEFIEESPSRIQCILTVTIPTHTATSTRCYSTSSEFTRRSDAKGEAARIAIDMDVIGFLKSASSANISRDRATLLARAAERPAAQVDIQAGMKARQDIDRICKEWRVGVTPEYTLYRHRKGKERETGCALRISLTPHVRRVFSTGTDFSDPEVAKAACALLALEEGVVDFIMHGNGQKAKPQAISDQPLLTLPPRQIPSYIQMSVQEFFDALPRPFVEPIDDGKIASDVQWANMLNMIIQGAKMHGLKTMFYFTDTETRTGLTGCVLRVVISDPSVLAIVSPSGKELVKTYIVDPHFVKTNDAKTAVCMVAITQNLRGYLADISSTYDKATKHSREFDRKVSEATYRMLSKLLRRKTPPTFEYVGSTKPNGFGCSLSVDVSSDPASPDMRRFSTVSSHYGSKPDARIAALVEAAKRGIVEQLIFPPEGRHPAGYRCFWEVVSKGGTFEVPATKTQDGGPDNMENGLKAQRKKRKRTNGLKPALNVDVSKATSTPARPAEPSGTGSEPGEISELESSPPSKRIAPPKIIRSASSLSSRPMKPSVTSTQNGVPGISPDPMRWPPANKAPALHRPAPQRLYHSDLGRDDDAKPPSVRGYPPVITSQPPPHDYSYPHTYSRPSPHSTAPPPLHRYSYPDDSAFPPPPHYTLPPMTAGPEYRSPYSFPPPIPHRYPPSYPPPLSAPPPQPYSPHEYPEHHPPYTRHDPEYPQRPPRDPPSRYSYPYDGYPSHTIPHDTVRPRDYEPYHQDDYRMPEAEEAREYWSRYPEEPRYYDRQGRYAPPPEAYPP
ncbi:hypothetical protein FA13DRAFT_1816903 [Coprinellus micaceus]|uniref:EF-hand domain-containing protein n=1 Tax=Coprinellus micaceus TaxID=71717 RepID=A0A4Y7SXV0_COPMI|nr:hypothetical protein FA13DRAFT_1816903 [Coprinellus micaceus]